MKTVLPRDSLKLLHVWGAPSHVLEPKLWLFSASVVQCECIWTPLCACVEVNEDHSGGIFSSRQGNQLVGSAGPPLTRTQQLQFFVPSSCCPSCQSDCLDAVELLHGPRPLLDFCDTNRKEARKQASKQGSKQAPPFDSVGL